MSTKSNNTIEVEFDKMAVGQLFEIIEKRGGVAMAYTENDGQTRTVWFVMCGFPSIFLEEEKAKQIKNPITGKKYKAKEKSSKRAGPGEIKGLWKLKKKAAKGKIVQIFNPKTKRWVMVDRASGMIVARKNSPGPYKNIPVAAEAKE